VNGAHLKPLDRSDMKPKIGVQWNPMINTTEPHNLSVYTVSEKLISNKEDSENITRKFPETCEEFLQSWRTILDYSEKFIYVWNLR